jgi:hypothetical protein
MGERLANRLWRALADLKADVAPSEPADQMTGARSSVSIRRDVVVG